MKCSLWAFLVLSSILAIRPEPQCLDGNGDPVDWWFIYKVAKAPKAGEYDTTGFRYIYYDSYMASTVQPGQKHTFLPMSYGRMINDPNTSPLLRTIYTPFRLYNHGEQEDNNIFIAVNDQPFTKKDAFQNDVEKSGHVKFITAAQVNMAGTGPNDVIVSSFLIQHTLPQFPAFALPEGFSKMRIDEKRTYGPIYGSTLPPSDKIFASNLSKNGQHFMCMSFKDHQKTQMKYDTTTLAQWTELEYDKNLMPAYLSSDGYHFAKILHYLKVTHAAVVGTNYNPFKPNYSIYHRYLNVFYSWGFQADYRLTNNISRHLDYPGNYDSDHLCPMWPLHQRVRLDWQGNAYTLSNANATPMTMRSSADDKSSVCNVWNPAAPSHLCLASAKLKTTSKHYGLTGLMIMKNKRVPYAPFDDLVSPLVVPLQDFQTAANIDKTTAEKKTMEMSLIVQSWIDFATLPEDTRQLMPEDSPLQVSLNIVNNQGITVPTDSIYSGYYMKTTKDHSKWALAFPKAMTGTFAKLFCISDLNRTLKHMNDPGRGGATICFSNGPFTELFLSLRPTVERVKTASTYHQVQHLYHNFDQALSSTVRYSDCMRTVYISDHRKANEMSFLCCSNPFSRQTPVRTVALPAINRKLLTPYRLGGPTNDDVLLMYGDFSYGDFTKINPEVATLGSISPFETGVRTKFDEPMAIQQTLLQIDPSYWAKVQHLYQAGKRAIGAATVRWLRTYLRLDVQPVFTIVDDDPVAGLTQAIANVKITDTRRN